MTEKKIVLVTGAYGVVGKAIQEVVKTERAADEEWIFVNSKDGDLRDKKATDALLTKFKPTHVIHLAAKVGTLYYNMKYNLDFFRENMAINNNFLQACYETGVKKVVSCLSSDIFPDKTTYPIDETMIHNGPPDLRNFGYIYAKRMIDVQNRGYFEQHGCMYTSAILCNIFGPYDQFDVNKARVVAALIRRMSDAKDKNEITFTVLGSGKPLRQFVYSLDLARLLIWSLRNYNSVEPIALTVDEADEVTIAQAAEAIKRALNYPGRLVFDTSVADGQLKKTASNKKLRTLHPTFRFTSFDDAIKETVDWYMKNRNVARN